MVPDNSESVRARTKRPPWRVRKVYTNTSIHDSSSEENRYERDWLTGKFTPLISI